MLIRTAHASLQFSDPDKQHTHDVEKIFDRAVNRRYAWITGTEAGPGAGNTGEELLRVGKEAGYKMWVPSEQTETGIRQFTDCWLAVRKDLIKEGSWRRGFDPVIPGSEKLKREGANIPSGKRWAPKGLVRASWDSTVPIGPIGLGVAHYLTDARTPDSPYWKYNEALSEQIQEWAVEAARGVSLAFYNGDQNMNDRKSDTFMGGDMESMADELKRWQNTGHGPIDVMASCDRDKRVRAKNFKVLDDSEFKLFTDHFFCEGTYAVDPLPH